MNFRNLSSSVWICFAFMALIALAFGRAIHYPYIVLDDIYYLSHNEILSKGLTWQNIRWAFTTFQTHDWQPLTWLSWMISAHFWGVNSAAEHSINILLHLGNTLLLFVTLKRYTGTVWRAALVTALFAIHPMRIESVVWTAERKDVLAGFFWMLSMLAYYRYVQKPSTLKRTWLSGVFLLGLMSKPILVVLPFLLLLLDYWPLKRAPLKAGRLILEKTPLFLLTGFSCVMTLLAAGPSLISTEKISIFSRVINAVCSYAHYIIKTLWPYPLAHFYPHPMENYSFGIFILSLVLLSTITFFAFYFRAQKPFLLVGWLWFLIALFPTSGLLQVGLAGMADRYTYFPHIGFFLMTVWLIPENKIKTPWVIYGSAAVILIFTALAFIQTGYWRDSETLDRHTLKVTGQNPIVQSNMNYAVIQKGMKSNDVESLLKLAAEPYKIDIPAHEK